MAKHPAKKSTPVIHVNHVDLKRLDPVDAALAAMHFAFRGLIRDADRFLQDARADRRRNKDRNRGVRSGTHGNPCRLCKSQSSGAGRMVCRHVRACSARLSYAAVRVWRPTFL